MTNTLHTDLSLKYLAHLPADTTNRPLIIFLHGYGSNEEDLFELKNEFSPEYIYLSVRAPMDLYQGSYQWFSLQMPLAGSLEAQKQVQDHAKLLQNFVKEAATKYKTTADKVLLIGFSQGAIMSYELALRNPDSVKGIIALSGRISPILLPEITPGMNLGNLAVFIGHGTKDDRIHVRDAISANEILSKTSITPEYHEYAGLGHSINMIELADIREWILKTL